VPALLKGRPCFTQKGTNSLDTLSGYQDRVEICMGVGLCML
jgi:hypothetical protein